MTKSYTRISYKIKEEKTVRQKQEKVTIMIKQLYN